MNEDIRISTDFPNHRKTQKLYRKLGAEGCFSLVKLWATAANRRPDGDLSGYDSEDIEIDSGWPGNQGEFFKAILEIGFIDKTDDGYILHNWELRQPWAIGDITRSEKGRFNRLRSYNKDVFLIMTELGYEKISKIDYNRISKIGKTDKNSEQSLSKTEIKKLIKKALNCDNENKNPLGGDLEVPQATLGGYLEGDLESPQATSRSVLTPAPAPIPAPTQKTIHQDVSTNNIYNTNTHAHAPAGVAIEFQDFCEDCKIPRVDGACPQCGKMEEF